MAELDLDEGDIMVTYRGDFIKRDRRHRRFPYCVVWTPIPLLSCLCGNCTSLSPEENVCCRETPKVMHRCQQVGVNTCITEHPGFEAVALNPYVLQAVYGTYLQLFGDMPETMVHRWVLPFIGHMGICTSAGIIRDFAGSYYVSEDNMGFGKPTKYWKLDVDKVCGNGAVTWDKAVYDASEEYKSRPHNLCLDNCHSHVAMALNLMRYDNSSSWNMMNLCALTLIHGRHVSWAAFFKTWLPFFLISGVLSTFVLTFYLHE